MTSTSLIGQPQPELKYKINVEQELLDLHLLCVYVNIGRDSKHAKLDL
jgi:hypothetical protein